MSRRSSTAWWKWDTSPIYISSRRASPVLCCGDLAPISLRLDLPHPPFARATRTMVSNEEVAAYLRVSSLAIALFDYVQTFPGEMRLYYGQTSLLSLSPACILFILVRYTSVAALVTSNVGFFGSGFSLNACRHFYLVAPVLKLIAVLISQVIIGVRTYAISRKSRWVFWALVAAFVLALAPEILGNVVRRVVAQTPEKNCTSGNLPGAKLAWLHYLAAMLYDAFTMGIATWYLVSNSRGNQRMSRLSRLLLEEGLIYFIALTAFNVLNLVLFRSNNLAIQSSATTLGQAITMIFSQKFILALNDHSSERTSRMRDIPRSFSHKPFPSNLVRSFMTTQSMSGFDSRSDTKSQAIELDIRVEKDVEITVDNGDVYSPTLNRNSGLYRDGGERDRDGNRNPRGIGGFVV
ncbi:hypothetical protein SCHPADRAFT_96723 [Schizopora paradoxa]|uniref:DUF6533 domain-containing protein n=1 Tax=Schizopora paradoxa TaxID=27342 RepID=A0A0H2S3Z0_9AGAM|nr:hypothetical protein SCHPADRAFT_96723 [Schizopora paradoxa]